MAKGRMADHEVHLMITDAQMRVDEANAELVRAVWRAREAGWSWRRIGELYGVSKQAAQQRFERLSRLP